MEVRKEAFHARKSRKTSKEEDEDEEDAEEHSSISEGTLPALVEEWETWYPQEWVGWIMYGVPSDKIEKNKSENKSIYKRKIAEKWGSM